MNGGESWGWNGPVGEMIKEAALAGCYRQAMQKSPAHASAFGKLADVHSVKVAALARGIGEAGRLLDSAGLTNAKA